ncbi:MAG: formate dehydrogenase accessory protein FdhE [Bacillota bacterium]|nr:formate dehydrogenase accessory protein FdhE [Bacillota bacterium]
MIILPYKNYREEIDRCIRLYGNFREAVPFIEKVFAVLNEYILENPIEIAAPLDEMKTYETLQKGQSLNCNPPLNSSAVIGMLKKVGVAIKETNTSLKNNMKVLEEAGERFLTENPDKMGKKEFMELRDELVKENVLEQDMATFIFSIVLSSFYRQYLQPVNEVLRTDIWEGGDCPLCGEKPHFGMLRSSDGAKQLECWLCGTRWVYSRVKCPYCGNEEREELGYFSVEGMETCRVYFCRQCCQYYKIFDGSKLNMDGAEILTIHNLATLTHDLLARREGFSPGSGLEWINQSEIVDRHD